MTATLPPNQVRSNVYAKGLKDERVVKEFLKVIGKVVTSSTADEDRFQDIDCYVNGVAASIKAQHSGAQYQNIGFELAQHLTAFQECPTSKTILSRRDSTVADVDRLVASGSWERSWWDKGTAAEYYIYQGNRLYVYQKADIVRHVEAHGWLRLRSLSWSRKSYQGGTYRYCNAICGYLDVDAVAHKTYKIVRLAGAVAA